MLRSNSGYCDNFLECWLKKCVKSNNNNVNDEFVKTVTVYSLIRLIYIISWLTVYFKLLEANNFINYVEYTIIHS